MIRGHNDNGMARRWYIPPEWNGIPKMNLLEFLASEFSIYMTIQQLGHRSHVLAFTDSSSALGWMHKEYYDLVNEESHAMVARWLGWTLISNEVFLCSQHIKVTKNIIAEFLSRDLNISDQSLTKVFNSILPPHTAASFHIQLPSREIISWILSLAASLTRPRESPNILRPSILATSKDGAHCSHPHGP